MATSSSWVSITTGVRLDFVGSERRGTIEAMPTRTFVFAAASRREMISRYPSSGEAVLTSPATTPAPLHGTVNPPTPEGRFSSKATSEQATTWSLEPAHHCSVVYGEPTRSPPILCVSQSQENDVRSYHCINSLKKMNKTKFLLAGFEAKVTRAKVNPKKGSNLDLDESPSRLLHSRRRRRPSPQHRSGPFEAATRCQRCRCLGRS